jgi:glycerol-3-phosphate acyltransferase PlsY
MMILAAALFGYLLGSIPFGLVLTRLAGLGDVRNIGSGSIGATNVLRTGSKSLALATLLLDGGKGAVAVVVAGLWDVDLGLIAGAGAMLGHCFPVWLRFKGGKGVATALGTLLVAAWPVGVLACLTWLAVALLFRYSSLASLTAIALAPAYAWWLATPGHVWLAAAILPLVVVRHHENIGRLLRGEESKIRLGGRGVAPPPPGPPHAHPPAT